MRSLNQLLSLQRTLVRLKRFYYTRVWGMDIHKTVRFSLSARFDKTNPRGLHIGAETYIAFDAAILTHDMTRGIYLHTRIGRRCFIGARSIIMPGVTIGDECIVGSGAVVTKSVPPHSVVVGNPAKVIQENVSLGRWGRFPTADGNPGPVGR